MRISIALALLVGAAAFAGCGSTKPESEKQADTLHAECTAAITALKNQDSSIGKWFQTAHGYAIFPSIGKGAVGIGGAYGRGEVQEDGKLVGYTTIKQGTIGLALGGQSFTEVIFFKDKAAMSAFKEGNYQFAATASAVAVKEGAGAGSAYSEGVKVFTLVKGGLMAEASVGGQKFAYEPK
jgi:lipid-binding SYLF domain-containing protein